MEADPPLLVCTYAGPLGIARERVTVDNVTVKLGHPRTLMKRFIVHIGHVKTGSSTIQAALRKNQEELANADCVFFDRESIKTNLTSFQNKSTNPTNDRSVLQEIGNTQENLLAKQAREYDTVIVSDEALARTKLERTRAILDEIWPYKKEVHFIVYIREPVEHYTSLMAYRLPDNRNIYSPTRYKHLAYEKLNEFRQIGDLTFRKFERTALIDGDVQIDFETILTGILQRRLDFQRVKSKNVSLTAEQGVFLNRYIRSFQPEFLEQNQKIIAWLVRLFKVANNDLRIGTKLRLKPSVQRLVQENCIDFFKAMSRLDPGLKWEPHDFSSIYDCDWTDDGRVESIVDEFDEDLVREYQVFVPFSDGGELKISEESYKNGLLDFYKSNGIENISRPLLGNLKKFFSLSEGTDTR
ncbi:MAG: hypothetical protein AAF198_03780 [Pseudomonadota bacterium]